MLYAEEHTLASPALRLLVAGLTLFYATASAGPDVYADDVNGVLDTVDTAIDDLTAEEEEELLKYLAFLRFRKSP